MAIDALVLPLLSVPLFQGLKPLQLTEIARRADRIVYNPGDVIISENQSSDAAVLVVSGDAQRISGPGLGAEPEMVPVGSLIAEMTMIIDTECTSTIVARTRVRALRITRSEMLAQMTEDPALAGHFISKISDRLSTFVDNIREIDESLLQAEGANAPAAAFAGQATQPVTSSAVH
jgi:CRP-like cAMP-binding protein